MSYDPTKPVEDSPLDAAEMRRQFAGLMDLLMPLQNQLLFLQQQFSPLVPQLTRNAGGQWTLAFAGPTQALWQIWARSSDGVDWANFGEVQTSEFPATDEVMTPGGVWWQVKICGEGDFNCQTTPFSNIISFGPVPS